MTTGTRLTLDQPARYQIVVQGRLPENWNDFFSEMASTITVNGNGLAVTTLVGTVSDQSTLHGLLRRIRDLGLPLIEVKLLSDTSSFEGENYMFQTRSSKSIFNLACKGIALAMSVAAIVLNILKTASSETLVTLLTIGLAALALSALNKE
jgi:hypothetical protein